MRLADLKHFKRVVLPVNKNRRYHKDMGRQKDNIKTYCKEKNSKVYI